ncbi:hypothetical protein [Limosilactobacillus mucosae]|uniref:Uncharacterized protein n=1 Tax=Limosilactobacillus mucosae TaxID=97478 RepID=A0AAJ1HPX8_LIMMU|nr:hypothetical protein [Limosilactobacillus mucosae]MDC2827480.1 hypothetical protein [Limosilactobacillus mucosae]MDC2835392.1 hypothetical protein [Limosilactobacillus mucosae]
MAGYSTKQLLEWYLQGYHEIAITHGLTLSMLKSYLQEHDYDRDLQYRMIKTLERELKAMNKDKES